MYAFPDVVNAICVCVFPFWNLLISAIIVVTIGTTVDTSLLKFTCIFLPFNADTACMFPSFYPQGKSSDSW